MSGNVDVIRASYEASAQGDPEGIVADLAEDAQWREMEGGPYAGVHRGPAEVLENVIAQIGQTWEDFAATPETYLDAGDTVVVLGEYTGTFRETGKSLRARYTHVWRLENGRIVAFEQFTDTLLWREAMTA